MKKTPATHQGEQGLTLIEISIATLIIGVSVAGSVALLRAVIPGVAAVHNRSVAMELSQAKVEQLKNELLMQTWWTIPVINTTTTPVPTPGIASPGGPEVAVGESNTFRTDWEITYVDPTGVYAIPTPVPTLVGAVTAPTGLIRIRAHTDWYRGPSLRNVEVVSYVNQRDLATPTPGNTPVSSGFFTVGGLVTDNGKPVAGGGLVLVSTMDPNLLPDPLNPGFTAASAVYSGFVGTDGRYVIRFPGDVASYSARCWLTRMSPTGTVTEVMFPSAPGVTASSGGVSTVNFPF